MVQNDKKFCLSLSISQEPYIKWLSFKVQMCKIIISPGVFFNFKTLIFWVVWRAEMAKNDPKWQKFLSVAPYISGTIYRMIFIYGTRVCIKGYLHAFFPFFFKILIFKIIRGGGGGGGSGRGRGEQKGEGGGEGRLKGQKMAQNDKKFCLSHSVSQELYIIWLWFLLHICKMMMSWANFFILQNLDFWGF